MESKHRLSDDTKFYVNRTVCIGEKNRVSEQCVGILELLVQTVLSGQNFWGKRDSNNVSLQGRDP